jgi:hypothetical protein
MTWAQGEQARCRAVYEACVSAWYRARSEGHIVEETDSHERSAGVRWRATGPEGKTALSAFQFAKSNLDHISERVQREAGNEECPTCPKKDSLARMQDRLSALAAPDSRLPIEHDEEPVSP